MNNANQLSQEAFTPGSSNHWDHTWRWSGPHDIVSVSRSMSSFDIPTAFFFSFGSFLITSGSNTVVYSVSLEVAKKKTECAPESTALLSKLRKRSSSFIFFSRVYKRQNIWTLEFGHTWSEGSKMCHSGHMWRLIVRSGVNLCAQSGSNCSWSSQTHGDTISDQPLGDF